MRGIARLLFGDDAGKALDQFNGNDDGFGLADQTRRSGEWCGSTLGRDTVADALRGVTRRGGQRAAVREFPR
jgi:hypothetical protein